MPGMSPSEIRKRAWRSLGTASLTLDQGNDPDSAAYLIGQAVESMLKARACAVGGLQTLPDDRKELRRHKLDDHTLDRLLNLTDGAAVQRSALDGIDWSSLSEWNNQDRYKPVGHVTHDQACRRLVQARRLFRVLIDHEIVQGLQQVEARLSGEGVIFNLFEDGSWN